MDACSTSLPSLTLFFIFGIGLDEREMSSEPCSGIDSLQSSLDSIFYFDKD